MANHLQALNLCYSPVLRDINLSLEPGELVALIGPNGAGKSTLLRVLTGYLSPDNGQCLLHGKSLCEWSAQALSRHRAVMRQQSQLGFDWPVDAVIAMGRAPWEQADSRRVVKQVMDLTGCAPLSARKYNTLSGGEQQRVQLARALAQLWVKDAPQGWLFLDEPTSALDLYHQQHLLRLLKQLTATGQLHVCAVLHDLNLAALWADKLLLLHQGEIVAQGSPQQVLQADTLRRWYGAEVHIGQHPGSPTPQVFLAP
ncbi:heme ABC transporter ATP-binding protein [Scandinavium sp. V105_1]|uniref:Heme ABC transporter ATP-binding protein n=1 Tax=Scandinavium lactucae TaxID=3095028 RepID=A0ABU4QRN6_9ENTR|nr:MULTISPECIES: heme ABC transporter ATP-binding protein [unclassified Scandinavium]MDX6041500.1 heme ABC transporter ATP-binding protein [Scandinavium sp. V105_6]MDX6051981.1 heme ABC transporter ATP-binding protein [Scandinavium sp. V105_1]